MTRFRGAGEVTHHPTASTRVLIADDDVNIREALCDLLESEDGVDVVAIAVDATQAIAAAARERPDVAILDVSMPKGGGPDAARGIRIASPETRIVALSAHDDRASMLAMVNAGATAYLVKGSLPEELTQTIQRVRRGESTTSSGLFRAAIGEPSHGTSPRWNDEQGRLAVLDRIRGVIQGRRLRPVYQPIIDLNGGAVTGVEALSRFDSGLPSQWFEEAAGVGLREDLELAAIALAVKGLAALPPGAYLSLNVSPATVLRRDIAALLDAVPMERIVIEMSELAQVDGDDGLTQALRRLRAGGVRVAVDDAGAGFESLRRIVRLRPDIIKLDVSVTRGIEADRPQRALTSALVAFARETQAEIVAEGIETSAELRTLRDIGVTHGQGFLLARPGDPPIDESAIGEILGR